MMWLSVDCYDVVVDDDDDDATFPDEEEEEEGEEEVALVFAIAAHTGAPVTFTGRGTPCVGADVC